MWEKIYIYRLHVKLLRYQSLFLLIENDLSHAVLQEFAQMTVMVMKLTVMKTM